MESFYITTPIYYVNDRPHIGHAYTTIVADVLSRWNRMNGASTILVTGTDENAQKNVEAAAKKLEVSKDDVTRQQVQAYVDEMSALWQRTWDSLDIHYDTFIRTTDAAHVSGVAKFIAAVQERGDIYRGTYSGWYCVGCEAFIPEKDLDGGMCPSHIRVVDRIEEENYFFRLSKYRDALLGHMKAHPEFIQPVARRNEIIAYIRDHLEDVSISRPMRNWGIPFPGDAEQSVYVWFDALGNYLTAVGYGTNDATFSSQWPASVHLIGKDILKFHCALWPAMLLSADLPLPERIFAHGFFTIDGKKMSKSIGNVVDPILLAERFGNDVLRYFLLREITFGGDGDFSEVRLRERYASDLQHGIGNFAARTLSMVKKYRSGIATAGDDVLKVVDHWTSYRSSMERLDPGGALDVIEAIIRSGDQFIESEKPWMLAKNMENDRLDGALGSLVESLRHVGLMLAPFMPKTAEAILRALAQDNWTTFLLTEQSKWGILEAGIELRDLPHLFPEL
jgi:methionyl-tRNA synthetase